MDRSILNLLLVLILGTIIHTRILQSAALPSSDVSIKDSLANCREWGVNCRGSYWCREGYVFTVPYDLKELAGCIAGIPERPSCVYEAGAHIACKKAFRPIAYSVGTSGFWCVFAQ